MPNKRDLNLSQYNISKYAYRELENFCLQYPEKKRKIADLHNPLRGVAYDGMPHGSTPGEPTASAAERAAQLSKDIEDIEQCAIQACPDNYQCLILYVTEDVPHHYLKLLKGLTVGRDTFNNTRRYFYYLLAKRKNII